MTILVSPITLILPLLLLVRLLEHVFVLFFVLVLLSRIVLVVFASVAILITPIHVLALLHLISVEHVERIIERVPPLHLRVQLTALHHRRRRRRQQRRRFVSSHAIEIAGGGEQGQGRGGSVVQVRVHHLFDFLFFLHASLVQAVQRPRFLFNLLLDQAREGVLRTGEERGEGNIE